MQLAANPKDFLARPVGRCIVGQHWLYFCVRDGLAGYALWGVPTREDIDALVVVLEGMLGASVPVHATLVDTSRVDGMEPGGFESLTGYVSRNRPVLERKITRVSLVRPAGLFGAAARGFFAIVEAPYAVEVFAKVEDALYWLGEGAELVTEIERLYVLASDTTPLLRELRTLLGAQLGNAALPSAARTLGVSPRAMQRHLQDAGTTFRDEQRAQQMLVAERMLLKDASITQIAYAVGCASPAHFSELFRKCKGDSPTTWRAAQSAGFKDSQRAG